MHNYKQLFGVGNPLVTEMIYGYYLECWCFTFTYSHSFCYRTLARFSKRSRRQAFVNSERFPPNPGSPTPHPTSPPIPTIHHPHHHNQTLAPHLHGNGYSTDDSDGMGGSIQWALSRSQSRRYQPPRVLSPASVGKDILERQSLIGRGRASSYGSHPHSINS